MHLIRLLSKKEMFIENKWANIRQIEVFRNKHRGKLSQNKKCALKKLLFRQAFVWSSALYQIYLDETLISDLIFTFLSL